MLGFKSSAAYQRLRRFFADEQGDEGVNKILIIALIAVPLIIVLIIFGREIVTWFEEAWTSISDEDDIGTNKGTPATGP